jgi:adenine-specific DNA-methyltransferase
MIVLFFNAGDERIGYRLYRFERIKNTVITDKQLLELQRDYEKLKAENAELKKKKKFGLVWEEQSSEKNIDDKEHYPFLAIKGDGFGFDNGETRKNILIEGDNYHALEILQYTHKGAVDVIYIDPPYNTGKKKEFRYNDHWVDKEDGYRHSKWLSFMDKRLRLARELLKKEGVVFISIDDNEQARLKVLCDEIFVASNFLACVVWNQKTGTQAGHFTGSHEYVLAYARNKSSLDYFMDDSDESIKHGALKKISKVNPASEITFPAGMEFEGKDAIFEGEIGGSEKQFILSEKMIFENGLLKEPVTLRAGWAMRNQVLSWIDGQETFDSKGQKVSRFFFNKSGVLWYEKERDTQHPKTVIEAGGTQTGSKELKDLFSNVDNLPFKFPKPINLIQKLSGYVIKKRNNPVILDFFAGSGTTGHAVMDLALQERERERERAISADEEASRVTYNPQFILVTNNENNICEEVCYERLKRANEKYGYGSNLEYLKTELLEYDPERHCDLDIRAFMVEKITEIIKVREACFKIEPITNYLQKFVKDEKSVYVLHNVYDMKPQDYKDAVEILATDSNDKINIYVLAMSNHAHYAQKLFKCGKQITFEPLPESFLKLLRKIDTNIRKTK